MAFKHCRIGGEFRGDTLMLHIALALDRLCELPTTTSQDLFMRTLLLGREKSPRLAELPPGW